MPEEIIDPALPICDAHHHLWDRPTSMPARYLLDEFLEDLRSGHRIESTVFVEAAVFYSARKPTAMQPVGEVEFAAGVGAMADSGFYGPTRVCAAIVGHADLRLGDAAAEVLEALVAASGRRLAGVRHMAPWDESIEIPRVNSNSLPNLYGDQAFRAGFAHLARLGLSFDAFQWHTQLPQLLELARAFPETRIALNHLGSPIGIGPYQDKRDEVFAGWASDICALAACPNVVVKLGGMGLRVTGFGFNERVEPVGSQEIADTWRPYFETCIQAFGPERCMFESNFPVDRISCSYATLWNAFKRIARAYSAADKAAMFKGTAENFYGIAG